MKTPDTTITYGGEACTPDGGGAAVPYRIRIERGGSDVALTCSARFARNVAVHCDAERLAGADVLIRWPHAYFPSAAEVGRLIEAAMTGGEPGDCPDWLRSALLGAPADPVAPKDGES